MKAEPITRNGNLITLPSASALVESTPSDPRCDSAPGGGFGALDGSDESEVLDAYGGGFPPVTSVVVTHPDAQKIAHRTIAARIVARSTIILMSRPPALWFARDTAT